MKKSYAAVLVFAVVLFISFFRIGSVLLFDVDEAVFSEATKEMVQSGDYISTTYNGEPRYDKPIFFYWLMAASYKIFGINEFGARFPSALTGCLLAAALFFFVRHFRDLSTALYAVLSMVLSAYYLVYSRSAVTDMTLTLFITLSLFCFYLSLKQDRRYIYGLFAFSALAFLTKGLIGIVFPFAIPTVFLLLTEGIGGLRRLINLKAAMLFLVIGVPWYAAEYAIKGDEFIEQFFIKHHFRRYTEVISGHKGPVYYYLAALVVGFFPWVAFLPAGINKIFKDRDPLLIFSGIWLAFIVIFFSFATTKLPDYILSAIPAACILVSAGMNDKGIRWMQTAWVFIGIVSVAAGFAFVYLPSYLVQKGIAGTEWMPAVAVIALVVAALCFYAAIARRPFYGALASGMFVFLTALVITALPVASEYLQGPLHKFSLYGKEKTRADERIITYGLNKPSIVFYSDRKVVVAGGTDELQRSISEGSGKIVIAKAKDAERLKQLGLVVLDTEKGYALLEKE
ncbi:MAG TPA: glycosyltransferase family 39 protein [Dissulfurispiraceae bacterium]|nr:glycosyltransferase family 39 protein [Dissulfurispiraceae bacterium]